MEKILAKYPEGLKGRPLLDKINAMAPHGKFSSDKSVVSIFAKVCRERPNEFSKKKEGNTVTYFFKKSTKTSSKKGNTSTEAKNRPSKMKNAADQNKQVSGSANNKKRAIGRKVQKKSATVSANSQSAVSATQKTSQLQAKNSSASIRKNAASVRQKAKIKSKISASQVKSKHSEIFHRQIAEYFQKIGVCTRAFSLMDLIVGGKWGNPDVIGMFRAGSSSQSNVPSSEIVSIRIVSDPDFIQGFGQACSYCLFSHKVYLVVSKALRGEQIESLCRLFGLGLVYFDQKRNAAKVDFEPSIIASTRVPSDQIINDHITGEVANRLYKK